MEESEHPSRKKGPHGLGDPDDTFLRKVEKDILILEKVRTKARTELCKEEVEAFAKCAKDNGLMVIFKCRQENNVMQGCLSKWFYNEKLREECKQLYLQERAEFRRTGLMKAQREALKNKESS